MTQLTVEMLEKTGACEGGIAPFRNLFGEYADLTIRNIRKAQKALLDVEWLVNLMTPEAQKAYDEAVAPARKAYYEAVAPARKAYNEAVAPAQKAYDEAVAPARKAYYEAVAPARKAYYEAVAPALLKGLRCSL